ncbi:MAG: flagellar biosynthetic protein FliO [Deltaproteobacteria bacterium]|nr:flagellar biosynthetic protein FliO [Deltaproteobacteria bacterium]
MDIETNLINAVTSSQPDFYSTAIRTFSILFILLAVILIGSYLAKRFWPKGSGLMGSNQWIKVIATSYIAPKKTISLVEVAGEMLVLGLTDSQITMLTKINDEHRISHIKKCQEKNNVKSPFYQQLKFFVNGCDNEREKETVFLNKITSNPHENNKVIEKINMPGIKT